MLDLIFYWAWHWVLDQFRGAIRWNAPSDYRGIGFPILHSEGLRHMGLNGFMTFHYVAMWGQAWRSGLFVTMVRQGWRWVSGRQSLRMRRPIKLFKVVTVQTSIVAWDERAMILRTDYFQRGELCASNFVEVLIRGQEGKIPVERVIAALGGDFREQSPPWPVEISNWKRTDEKRPIPDAPAESSFHLDTLGN